MAKKNETPEPPKGTARNMPEKMNEEQLARWEQETRHKNLAELHGISVAEARKRDEAFMERYEREMKSLHVGVANAEGDADTATSTASKKSADAAGE